MFQLVPSLKRNSPSPDSVVDEDVKNAVNVFLSLANKHPYVEFLRRQEKPECIYAKIENCGYGVFALEDVPNGTFFSFTDGNIVVNPNPKKAQQYMKIGMLVPVVGNTLRTIDAVYTMGKELYSLNHACENPNLDLITSFIDLGPKGKMQVVAFFTNRLVRSGEQFTFNYYSGVPSKAKNLVIRKSPHAGFTKCLCDPQCPNYIIAAEPVERDNIH